MFVGLGVKQIEQRELEEGEISDRVVEGVG
jgi:hypothetical protein